MAETFPPLASFSFTRSWVVVSSPGVWLGLGLGIGIGIGCGELTRGFYEGVRARDNPTRDNPDLNPNPKIIRVTLKLLAVSGFRTRFG